MRDFSGFRCAMHEGPLPPLLQSGLSIEQRVDHRAFWGSIAGASRNSVRQDALDALQIGNLGLNVSQMIFGDDLHLGACPGSVIDQPKQPANLFERKA